MRPHGLPRVAYQEKSRHNLPKDRERKPGHSPLLLPACQVKVSVCHNIARELSWGNTVCRVHVTSHIGQADRDPGVISHSQTYQVQDRCNQRYVILCQEWAVFYEAAQGLQGQKDLQVHKGKDGNPHPCQQETGGADQCPLYVMKKVVARKD